ncbi:RHS repeat-associated core domain-containing protein [Erwinia sp. HDF1-3R]|uniref:RHS repeat-associated core domain-containing protein n=1 Tax=Erwinia sp. HDF1-3R TaxID=3141543 RepID=UPI0031F59823
MATGNTIGKLQYAPAPQGSVEAGSANPPQKKSWWSDYGDWVHTGLDVLGAVPVIGAVADGANAAIYTAEGDYGNAALSAASAAANFVPGGGAAFKAGKLAAKAGKAMDVAKVGKTAAKEGAGMTERALAKSEAKTVKAEASTTGRKAKRAGSEKGGSDTGKGGSHKTGPCKTSFVVANPVNPVLGIKLLFGDEDKDFEFPAAVPLLWQRSYFSDETGNGWLGQGWSLPFSVSIEKKGRLVLFKDEQGREIDFPDVQPGYPAYFHRYEQLSLSQPETGKYRLSEADGSRHWIFGEQVDSQRWLLSAIEDRHGNSLRLTYNAAQQPVEITDSAGRRFLITFSPITLSSGEIISRLTEVACCHPSEPHRSDPLCHYDYSDEGDLIAVRNDRDEIVRDFRYRNHMMVAHRLAGELACFYHYDRFDPKGKVIAHRNSLGEEWLFEYHADSTQVTDGIGRKTHYEFDENHDLTGYRNATGGYTRLKLNSRGQPLVITDPAGRRTRYRYDERGNITAMTAPDGQMTRVDYHPVWNLPVRITDMLGNLREFTYDVAGNLIREMDELGRITEYNHDDAGNLVRIRDAAAGIQRLQWNDAGFLIAHTDCSGRTTGYAYDKYGWLKERTDAAGNLTYYEHDRDGQPVHITKADGSSEAFEYDRWRRLTGFKDAAGQTTRWELAPDGMPVARIDALKHRISYCYDQARRLSVLTNENGAQYRMEYDDRDNLIAEYGFDGRITRYDYDASDRVISRTEYGDGSDTVSEIHTHYQRDDAGRLLEKLVMKGGTQRWRRTRFRYDELGRLIAGINHGGRVELNYDAAGQLLEEKTLTRGREQTLRHQYDELGNRTVTTLPDGRELRNFYYGSGHLIQINLDKRVISEITRDALHQEVSRSQGALNTEFVRDEMGRLITQRAGRGGKLKVAREYGWRQDGQLQQMVDLYSGDHRYQYDAIGRLTGAGEERFAFDPAHNLLSKDSESSVNDNRIRVYEDKRWKYDTHGNVTEKRTGRHTEQQFIWNGEHQLEEARSKRQGIRQTTTYGYDAFGRRSWKKDGFGITHFVWDGNRLLSEIRGVRSLTWVYDDKEFVPLAQISTTAGDSADRAEIHWYHTDQVGMPRELSDISGEISWRADYRVWGNTLKVSYPDIQAGEEPVYQPLRFQGQYYDAETGLHYNRFRYYDPDVGRFISQDPIGLAGGINLYAYAPNPLKWIDPLGLTKCNSQFNSRKEAFRAAKRDAGIPMTQQPDRIFNPKTGFHGDHRNVRMTDSHNNPILDKNGNQIWTREYQFTKTDGNKIVIQDHSAGHSYPGGIGNQGRHLNVRPIENIRTGSVPGTLDHYGF